MVTKQHFFYVVFFAAVALLGCLLASANQRLIINGIKTPEQQQKIIKAPVQIKTTPAQKAQIKITVIQSKTPRRVMTN